MTHPAAAEFTTAQATGMYRCAEVHFTRLSGAEVLLVCMQHGALHGPCCVRMWVWQRLCTYPEVHKQASTDSLCVLRTTGGCVNVQNQVCCRGAVVDADEAIVTLAM